MHRVRVPQNFSMLQLSNCCLRKGVSVDFTQRNPSEEYPEEEKTKLTKAMEQCKISIVTKMRSNSAGKTRHITSIWALSDDRETRMQQECEYIAGPMESLGTSILTSL